MKQIVNKRDDVAFYMIMFPILQLHPAAYDKSRTILCEESNEKAILLLEDVYAKKQLPAPDCDTDVVNKNIQLGRTLNIQGTPTLIFEDGTKISGAMNETSLLGLIDKHSIK